MIRNSIDYSKLEIQRSNFEFWDQLSEYIRRVRPVGTAVIVRATATIQLREAINPNTATKEKLF